MIAIALKGLRGTARRLIGTLVAIVLGVSFMAGVRILADTTRPDKLQRITSPTLVIHGRDDPFVRLPCGEDTARRIPGARLWVVDGMGHDMPPGVVECMLPPMLEHFAGASERAAA